MSTKKNMTPLEKVEAWRDGTRKINLKACSKEKLEKYRQIADEIGYTEGVAEIDALLNESANGMTRQQVEKFIESYESEIGDSGEDLFKESYPDKTLYGWGASRVNGKSVLCSGDIDMEVYDDHMYSPNTEQSYPFVGMTKKDLKMIMDDDLFNC